MKTFRKIFTSLIYFINLVLLVVPFVLEYFGNKKMMMHRFLLSKNIQFEAIFTTNNINIIRIILVAFVAISIFVFIKNRNSIKFASICVMLFSIIGIILTFKDFSLKAYYFVLLSMIINSGLSMINLGVNASVRKK